MEAINGVTFRDYACASANLVGGMPIEKICEVLGIEVPVWEAVQNGWNNKMAEMSMDDMKFYGEVFTNPKQGKFANVEDGVAGPEEILKKFPEWSDTIKMEKYMEHASAVGLEIDFDKEFGITITQYSQLAMHWSGWYKENVIDKTNGDEEASRVFALHAELTNKWDAFYKEKYKDKSAGISDDIDF